MLEAALGELERGPEVDRVIGQEVRNFGDGRPDENLSDRILQMEAEARQGELTSASVKAPRNQKEKTWQRPRQHHAPLRPPRGASLPVNTRHERRTSQYEPGALLRPYPSRHPGP